MEDLKQQSIIENISKCLEKIREKADSKDFEEYNESQVSQEFILPVLKLLGWKIEDASEVVPEFNPKLPGLNIRIDYALRLDKKPKVLIEVKKNEKLLDEDAKNQLGEYAQVLEEENIICVLTNGLDAWEFFVYNENKIEQVVRIPIENDQKKLLSAAENLFKYLAKEKVKKDEAIRNLRASKINKDKDKTDDEISVIKEKSWNYLFCNDFLQNELVKLLKQEILFHEGISFEEKELKEFIDKKINRPEIRTETLRKSKFIGNIRIYKQEGKNRITVYTSTEKFKFPSMKTATIEFIKDIAENEPDALEKYCNSDNNKGDKHFYITRTKKEATINEKYREEVNGWHVNCNLSNEQFVNYIWKHLCKSLKNPKKVNYFKDNSKTNNHDI